jgi:ferritin-like protein
MNRGRAPAAAEEYVETHLRIMVEQAVRGGKSEHEIETLLRQAEDEDRQVLHN